MFFHDKRLQYVAQPDKPDPVYAKKLQEVLGGQWGEIAVSLQYLFQGWACRGAMPNSFPQSLEHRDVSYQFWNCSSGVESQEGRWARGRRRTVAARSSMLRILSRSDRSRISGQWIRERGGRRRLR